MFNYKQLIIGFILGSVLFSLVPAGAAIKEYILHEATYKIVVNNEEYKDPDYPILNFKGTTYIPLRGVSETLGVNLTWNDKLNQAEINNTSKTVYNQLPTNWVSLDEYTAEFGNIPFIESTETGTVFTVRTSSKMYYFKYYNNQWYVKTVEV